VTVHFIGIGGAGMSGLALVCARLGATVTGSDRADSSYIRRLREAGINACVGHDAANLPDGAEVVVSTAIAPDNGRRNRRDTQLHLLRRRSRRDGFDHAGNEHPKIDFLQIERSWPRRHARHVEQIVDQLRLAHRIVVDRLYRAGGRLRFHVLPPQHPRPSDHRIQRRAQFVGED